MSQQQLPAANGSSGGGGNVLSQEEIDRRNMYYEYFCEKFDNKINELSNPFRKKREPTKLPNPSVMDTHSLSLFFTNDGESVTVGLQPDVISIMNIKTSKTIDEIVCAVNFIASDTEGLKLLFLPMQGKWVGKTKQCEFNIRIFLSKPIGEEVAESPQFTIEISRNCGCRYAVSEFFQNLRREVTDGPLTKQLHLADLYEEEQKQITKGVEGALPTSKDI